MTPSEIRSVLRSEEVVERDAFRILHEISCFVNDPSSEELGRELVLRAMEKRSNFNGFAPALDALTRQVGLFPYLEAGDLSFRDSLAYELHTVPLEGETF